MGHRSRVLTPGVDVRFVTRIGPTLFGHPAVVEAGRCPFCGTVAPQHAKIYRQRRIIETVVAAETETFDRPVHGVLWELVPPPHIGCGHSNVLPLPVHSGGAAATTAPAAAAPGTDPAAGRARRMGTLEGQSPERESGHGAGAAGADGAGEAGSTWTTCRVSQATATATNMASPRRSGSMVRPPVASAAKRSR